MSFSTEVRTAPGEGAEFLIYLPRTELKTDQFERTVRGEANLVVGRKGSGKTALFIQVRDKIRFDKRNVVESCLLKTERLTPSTGTDFDGGETHGTCSLGRRFGRHPHVPKRHLAPGFLRQ